MMDPFLLEHGQPSLNNGYVQRVAMDLVLQ